jgi:glutamate synthase (NADPH/NADH) small chain
MKKLNINKRIRCFKEVSLGYSSEQAITESKRCLQCKIPKCVEGCPVGIEIPSFINYVQNNQFEKAAKKIREKNSLPAICGRVCPQEQQCVSKCVLGLKGEAINIGALERFIADEERFKGNREKTVAHPTGKRVAIIGSGPAGLTTAAELSKLGYNVTIFEALHDAGGVLMYGIPEFRMPKEIVKTEVEYIKSLGVKIETNMIVGQTIDLDELKKMGYDAIFIGSGAGLPSFLGIPGENLCGIYSANEFLIRVNLMKAYNFPDYKTPVKVGKRVAVIGGGNVAVDAARSALRLGGKVTIIYRRTENLMPARREEVLNAKEEGIKFLFLTNPVRFAGDEKGWVKKVECTKMRLSKVDSSGRKKPVPIKGSEFMENADTVIVAIGTKPNTLAVRGEKKLKLSSNGTISVNPKNFSSNIRGIFAAGDIVTGNATVISAMAGGKTAAYAIHRFLMKKKC